MTEVAVVDRNSPACRKVTLGTQVYEALSNRLVGGELAPGEKISLRHIADGLGTSVMPVREAVSRLVADGALEVSPNKAVSVPVMTRDMFCELTTVRVAIEGFAAEQAAFNHRAGDLATLSAHDAAFRHECSVDHPDRVAALSANRDFHFALYAAADLPTLLPIITGLWLKIGPVLNLDLRLSTQRLAIGGAEAQHARCIEAVRRRDGAAARAAIAKDIETTAALIASTGRLAP
ncbi:GntR family transcriptional regulator [Acuticoccus sp. I52.16.1]|uniref:GntR family transcriptional regulator n=1 Tax=Acuticoccus sp. I52.16.1 TaxID=2928472 RepID=UPI001FD59280|nr:GntR family transcriptional regulator [Acuticoccus sp. I52.16.1]UOM33284.1 GntR family transcriptional regulator [Acuticoccus sp. I52.16.1]